MSRLRNSGHSISTLATVLLFGFYILFLLLLILFSADAYRVAVKAEETDNNLYTAMSYVTEKFRQHDTNSDITLAPFAGGTALCLADTIEDQPYMTYIYLQDNQLKELFTSIDSNASPDMGTQIAVLDLFQIEEIQNSYYQITMEDSNGNTSSFFLHPGQAS